MENEIFEKHYFWTETGSRGWLIDWLISHVIEKQFVNHDENKFIKLYKRQIVKWEIVIKI
jgi:hypothetical protein